MIETEGVAVVADGTELLGPTSVRIRAGSALVVRGPNGAGKSTFLRVLSGAATTSTGRAMIGGRQIDRRDPVFRRQVASLIGLPPFAPDLTIRDHLRLVSSTWGHGVRAGEALLDSLRITHLANRFPHELSSGQTQLMALGLVLTRPSDVLLLDEPEQRLDPERLITVAHILAERKAGGTTLAIASHSDTVVRLVADEILCIGSRP